MRNGIMDAHPFTMDAKEAQNSIRKLREIIPGCEMVLTSHYGYFKPVELMANV